MPAGEPAPPLAIMLTLLALRLSGRSRHNLKLVPRALIAPPGPPAPLSRGIGEARDVERVPTSALALRQPYSLVRRAWECDSAGPNLDRDAGEAFKLANGRLTALHWQFHSESALASLATPSRLGGRGALQ